jgi:hypothetical protein
MQLPGPCNQIMLQLTTPFCLWTLSLFDSLVVPRVVTQRLEASRQTCTLLPQSTRGRVVVYPAPVKAHRQVPDVSAPALCLTKRP